MSPPAFRSASPLHLPAVEAIIGYTFTSRDLGMKAINTLTNKKLASHPGFLSSYPLSNVFLANKGSSLNIHEYLTLHLGCEFISEKIMATVVKALINAVELDSDSRKASCESVFGVMGVFGIGNYRRRVEVDSGVVKEKEWGILALVCEIEGSGSESEGEVDLLGVPELAVSRAGEMSGVWNGESLI
jgi:hypothetical protein